MQLLIVLTCSICLSYGRRVQIFERFRNEEGIANASSSMTASYRQQEDASKSLKVLLRADAPRVVLPSIRHRLRLRRLRGGRGGRLRENHIFVKTDSGETIRVDAKDGETIAELKARIQDKEGIPAEEQRLVFGGSRPEEPDGKHKGSKGEIVVRPTPLPGTSEEKKQNSKTFDPSVEELEDTIRGAKEKLSRLLWRARRFFSRNRRVALAGGGLLGLMHGGSVAFTVLFVQSFDKSGWPLVRSGLRKGVTAYQEAKARKEEETNKLNAQTSPAQRELKQLAAKLARLRREGADEKDQNEVIQKMRDVRQKFATLPPRRRVFPILVAAFEPSVLRDIIVGVWSGVTVSLATACSSAARTIGIGVTLGEFVSKVALAAFSKLEFVIRRARSRLPAEAVMLGYLGPSLVGSAALNVLGRSIGCWLAYKLQHFAAIMSVSLLSASILLESLKLTLSEGEATNTSKRAELSESDLRKQEKLDIIAWMLALASVHSQHSKDYKLPLPLKILFLPVIGTEALLHKLANRLTESRFPKLL